MKKLIVSCLIFHSFYCATAQSSSAKKEMPVSFQSILQAGLLAGKSTSAFEVQSINGIKYKTFSASVGIGIDNYVFRTIPLFIDVRKDLLNRSTTPFVFADAGTQFSWLQDDQKAYSYFNPEYKSKFYFNAGLGYKIALIKRNAVVFSAAFSLKKVQETENIYCDFVACPEAKPLINNYTFKRLSLSLGWMIW